MNKPSRTVSEFLKLTLIGVVTLWVACIIALAIYHTRQTYAPFPVWDMWHSYILFYKDALAGEWQAWFARHNEHRLILDHLLMWADLRWFQGNTILLLVANYVLAGLTAAMFWLILRKQLPGGQFTATRILFGLVSTGALFLLCQGENLTWGMTGQFWLVLLLPLCGFYCQQKSPAGEFDLNFLLACLCGLGAAGSMASGLAVLPLMAVFALLTGQRASRIAVLSVLSVVVIVLYSRGSEGGGYSVLLQTLISNPEKSISYILAVLGHPFAFVVDSQKENVAEAFGAIFILMAAFKVIPILYRPRLDLLQTGIVFFLAFILMSVVAITGGRSQDLPSSTGRYATVAIMGWLSLLILYSGDLAALKTRWKTLLALATLPLMVLTINAQRKALDNWDQPLFEARAIMLGLALGVKDLAGATQIAGPGEGMALVPPLTEWAYAQNVSVFGRYPFRGSRERLGAPALSPASLPGCQGSVNGVETIITDPRFLRIDGRINSSSRDRQIQEVRLLDLHGIEIGSAVVGETTPDLNTSLKKRLIDEQFRGYVRASASGSDIVLQGEDSHGPVCRVGAAVPAVLYSAAPGIFENVNLDNAKILPENGWTGSDSQHTDLSAKGLHVYGSSKSNGDADQGSISLRMRRGERFLYRSGPVGGHQTMEIAGRPPITLAAAPDWVVLDFDSSRLPEGDFVVKLSDSGVGWGEWSAMAVRDKNLRPPPFSISAPVTATAEHSTISAANILPGSEWTGSDSFHTDLCSAGLRIVGSFKTHGDSDSGAISLRLTRGDKILYRSGPTRGNQVLEMAGQKPVILPVVIDWVMLDFSSPSAPEGQFEVKLTDKGTGWGEWSALALRDSQTCPGNQPSTQQPR